MMGNPNLKPETGNVWSAGYNFKIDPKTDAGIKGVLQQSAQCHPLGIRSCYVDLCTHQCRQGKRDAA